MTEGSRTEDIIHAFGVSLGEPSIAVVGVGGAGQNIVSRIYSESNRVDTVAVNTDHEHLRACEAHTKVLIGKDVTFGQDAGGFPEIGEHCAEKSREVLKEVLKGHDIVFIVAGMGGGTGTGAAPIVASAAKEVNAVTFAVPILPFGLEGEKRMKLAIEGVRRLREQADITVVLDHNKTLESVPDVSFNDAMRLMEKSVMKLVETVCDKTSSYVSNLMEDVTGGIETYDEPMQTPPQETPEQLMHAGLAPGLTDFSPPSMYDMTGGFR